MFVFKRTASPAIKANFKITHLPKEHAFVGRRQCSSQTKTIKIEALLKPTALANLFLAFVAWRQSTRWAGVGCHSAYFERATCTRANCRTRKTSRNENKRTEIFGRLGVSL